MQLRDTKFGYLKHCLCAIIFILACELTIRAEPISLTSVLVSLAISAALTAASIGLQMLMQPKPKPQDKNRLQGDIQLTNIGEDLFIDEIGGGNMPDGISGIKKGGNLFYASPIRKVVVTVPGQQTGGGKGAPKAPPTREYHYYIDLGIIWGRGSLKVRQIKANTDIIYQGFTGTPYIVGTGYEAENRTSDSANVTVVADVDMSGGQKVNLDLNEWIEWNNISATDAETRECYIVYKSTDDIDIEFLVNGILHRAVLSDSFGIRANVNLPQALNISSANTIRITNKTNAVLGLDRLVVGFSPIFGPDDIDVGGCHLSGAKYENWTNPEPTYDPYTLRSVYLRDDRGCEQWNYQSNPNALGEVAASIVSGGTIRNYPGNKTQLPDPLLQEHFEALYGAGSTPAMRNRCYTILENFEITKYGTVPNFTAVVEHETINSLGEFFAERAKRAGLTEDEFDFTELDAVPLRGYAITQKQAPAKEMEILCRVFDVDVYEDFDGIIKGVIPDETVEVTIPLDELDSVEGKGVQEEDAKPYTPVKHVFRDETELPFFLDVSYFDPSKDWETRNVHSLREVEASDRKANIETGLVMTEVEAQKFADRDLHKQYVEKDGIQINTFHKYTYLAPTNLIKVTDTDGATPRMRVKAMEGWIPGALDIRGVSRDADEFPARLFVVANNNPVVPTVVPPPPIIGTFIDLAIFREETTAGFYVAACLTDTHYQWAGAGLYREIEGDEWEALDGIPNQATMGLTVTGSTGTLGDPPATLATPDPPIVGTSPTGGSIGTAKSRKIKITYYDGTDESLVSAPTPIITTGSSSTITVESPAASTGATHYRVYVSNGGGPFELQNGSGTAIGTDFTMTSLSTGTAAPSAIWDDTNELTLDLYNGELETLTDDQVLEGRNFLVVGNEIIQFQTATRDNGFPNRWVISHLQRGIKGTSEASTGHSASERIILYTEAWRWIAQDQSLANVTRTYKFVASGGDLEKASSTSWSWDGRTQYNTSVYANVDNGVPVVTLPPIVALENGYWLISISRPAARGYSADIAEIRVRKDSDNSLVRQWDIGNTVLSSIVAQAFNCKIDYRWRNAYRLEGSDGWSTWSPHIVATVGSIGPPGGTISGGDPTDPGDLDPVGCFIDDVLVLMADWTEKPIQTVQRNDHVMSWDDAGRLRPGFVPYDPMQIWVKEYRNLRLGDDEIGVTETHPFQSHNDLKTRVSEMGEGLELKRFTKQTKFEVPAEVVSAEKVICEEPVRVTNFEVAILHRYLIRGSKDAGWKAVYNLSSKNLNQT